MCYDGGMEKKANKQAVLDTLANRPDLSYSEIGLMYGITKQRVHQIGREEYIRKLLEGIDKLRKEVHYPRVKAKGG
jgi:DNA-directed RNA polymerase sigma subunit (sigma70/sigma32)